jgi:hypothetical protein
MILVLVTLVAPQAEAKKRECTGAEMALLYNLKEMSFSIEVLMQDDNNQINFLTSRYSDFVLTQNTSSPNAVSLKNQIDALKSKVLGRKKQIDSLDKQSKVVLSKCTTTTVEQLQSSKARKVCTSNEKKAINSVIASFRSVQDKKRLWDGKKRVAEDWMSDSTKPSSIQATARTDFNKYSRYYEIEETKESFVISQFEFLNAGCRNSGLYLPRSYTPPSPAPTPTPAPNSNKGVYLIDWRFNYNPIIGGFTSVQRPDGSVMVQCKDGAYSPYPKWNFPIGLNLEGAKLLVTGSSGKDDFYTNFIGEYLGKIKNTLVPVERIDVLGSKFGRDEDFKIDDYKLYDIIGKSIKFSADGSICGLTTEPLSNLKQTLASDIQTAALFLLIKTDQNPGRIWPPGNQVAILIGSFTELSAEEKAAAEKAAAEKAASFVCIPGSKCPIGSTGPGGGIVFFDAGSQQSWGRYLEVAPADWRGEGANPSFIWCDGDGSISHLAGSITDVNLKASVGVEVGKGKANTDLMLAGCRSGSGHAARAFRGGNKNDWYLPSRDELNELCKFAKNQATGKVDVLCQRGTSLSGGFSNDYYWSSSESKGYSEFGCKDINNDQCRGEARVALFQTFVLGDTGWQRGANKNDALKVRPIRAFD